MRIYTAKLENEKLARWLVVIGARDDEEAKQFLEMEKKKYGGKVLSFECVGDDGNPPFVWEQSPYTAQARHLAKMDEEIHLAAQRGPRHE